MANLTISELLLAQNISNLLELSKRLENLAHAGTLGLLREALVEGVLCPSLPPPYKVASGVIMDFKGNQSGETDLVVWDDSIFRPLYFARSAGLFGVESVVATIEVKSTITREGVRQAFANAKKLASMTYILDDVAGSGARKDGKATLPVGIIFGFDSDQSEQDEGDRVLDVARELNLDAANYVQAVVVPGRRSSFFQPTGRLDFEPTVDFREVRMVLCAILNSIRTISKDRGQPKIGNYLVVD